MSSSIKKPGSAGPIALSVITEALALLVADNGIRGIRDVGISQHRSALERLSAPLRERCLRLWCEGDLKKGKSSFEVITGILHDHGLRSNVSIRVWWAAMVSTRPG